jgi:hypothetical protein
MKLPGFGHKPEHIDPRIPIERSRSRNYYLGSFVLGAGTTGIGYEATRQLDSGDQISMLIGGGLALVALGGAIATAGCIQSGEDHRKEAWRINEELRDQWQDKTSK